VVIGKREINNESLTVHYIYSDKSGEPEVLRKEELIKRLQAEKQAVVIN